MKPYKKQCSIHYNDGEKLKNSFLYHPSETQNFNIVFHIISRTQPQASLWWLLFNSGSKSKNSSSNELPYIYLKKGEKKMIVYKNIIDKLANAGYNTTRLRREHLISESVLSKIRHNESINIYNLNIICELTGLPIEELIEYKK